MNFKKILASVAATALTVTAVTTIASAEAVEEGVAVLGFGDADWKVSFWGKESGDIIDSSYETTAVITGNGTYTVGVDLSAGYTNEAFTDEETGDLLELTTANGIGAMGVQIYGENPSLGINITSVSFDGVDFPLTGVSYTNDEDGGRRSNVYNEWASFDSSKEDHISLDTDNATATVIDKSSLTEWSTCYVTFEVYGLDAAAETEAVADDTVADEIDDAVEEEAEVTEAEEEADAPVEVTEAEEDTSTDAATDTTANDTAVAGDTTTATADKASPDTGVEGVAVIAGIALVATGAIIATKKRK